MIRFNSLLSITDIKNLEAYFQKQMKKGYMIKKINRIFMTFEKCEPCNMEFSISLFMPHSMIEYQDDKEKIEFLQLAENTGWEFACSTEFYLVFCKEKGNPINPLYTESETEYAAIKAVFKKSDLIGIIIILLYVLIVTPMFWIDFSYTSLLSNSLLMMIIIPIVFFIILVCGPLSALIMIIKNRKNARQNEPLEYPSNMNCRIRGWVTSITFILFVLFTLIEMFHVSHNIWFFIICFLPSMVGILVGLFFRKKIITKKRSTAANVLILIGLTIVAITITNIIILNTSIKAENDAYIDDVINYLSMTDFDNSAKIESYTELKSSVFVPKQITYNEINNFVNKICTTDYEVINIFFKDIIVDGIIDSNTRVTIGDSKLWQCDEVYYSKGMGYKNFLIHVKGNRIRYFSIKFGRKFDINNDDIRKIILDAIDRDVN